MLKFLIKGVFRDRSRFLFPIIIVSAGVMLIVFGLGFMNGYIESMIRENAKFDTGHVKIMTKAYSELSNLKPYDLGMLDIQADFQRWRKEYPGLDWVQRINFGGIVDIADSTGNSLAQGQVAGFAVDLLHGKLERDFLHLDKALIKGRIPSQSGEVLLSDRAFKELNISLNDSITLMSSTVYGSMAMASFRVVGTVSFGVEALDKGGLIADMTDIQRFLDMEGGCSEILGLYKNGIYNDKQARELARGFNTKYSGKDEFSPVMLAMSEQGNMGYTLRLMRSAFGYIVAIFILIMGIVLWNSGLMNGIRRYGEIGVRLAIGEEKRHIYTSLLLEALAVGVVGSALGCLIGLGFSYYLSLHGLDMSYYTRNTSILTENVIYPYTTLKTILYGIAPGILSTLLGSSLAGIAVFRRQTSQLFKELET
ncbi:MAG TPA: FtsX-like permease family protein [Candidatus Cloacimonadota bacterium]|nr:FtsX-like permease family protein [Candidatus Cloacimonadota bacterium]HPS39433.1 FtsX-like permease family protein [Candidatus Cloacimonadota bacterium]